MEYLNAWLILGIALAELVALSDRMHSRPFSRSNYVTDVVAWPIVLMVAFWLILNKRRK